MEVKVVKRIAVEDSLINISDYLRNQGCDVCSLTEEKDLDRCDAVVVSGEDENFMGIHDTLTKAIVVDAAGKTAQEVYDQINNNTF